MTDPATEALFRLVELQSKLLTDALARMQPAPSPISQLRELVEVMQLAQPAPAPASPPSPNVGELGGPPWLPVVSRALEALERISLRGSSPVPLAAPAAAAAPPERIAVPRWLAPIIPYIRTLCSWADTGVKPELRAQIVAEELDPANRAALGEMLTAEGFPSSVIQAIPDFQPRESWFVPFFYALRAAIVPQLIPPIAGADAGNVLELDAAREEPAAETPPRPRRRGAQ